MRTSCSVLSGSADMRPVTGCATGSASGATRSGRSRESKPWMAKIEASMGRAIALSTGMSDHCPASRACNIRHRAPGAAGSCRALRRLAVLALVQRAVVENVDFDSGQYAERGQPGVEPADELQLRVQALGGQPAGHGQPGRVIRQRDPLVPETAGRLGHLLGPAAAIRPV